MTNDDLTAQIRAFLARAGERRPLDPDARARTNATLLGIARSLLADAADQLERRP